MEPYYFHRFRNFNLDALYSVVENGFILPRKMIKDAPSDTKNIFNGNSWISLSQKSLMDDLMNRRFLSSYNELIVGSLCAVIDKDIPGVVDTNYVIYDFLSPSLKDKIRNSEALPRFSEFLDEVQTDVAIPIEKFLAIGYPLSHFRKSLSDEDVIRDIEKIEDAFLKKGISIPILDSGIYDFADDEEHIALSQIKKEKSLESLHNNVYITNNMNISV